MTGWTIPLKQQREYLEACERCGTDDQEFRTFRTKPPIHAICGHIGFSDGQEYLDALVKESRIPLWAMNSIVDIDCLGEPVRCTFGNIAVSPTAFRYLYVVSGLLSLPRELSPLSIIELGGGYGGLAAIAYKFMDIDDYSIVDFHEVGLLQRAYLKRCDIVVKTIRSETFECHLKESYDLFISNYAFDELTEESQERYMEIVKRCRHGYVTVNQGKNKLRELLPCTETYIEPGECHPEVMRW